MRKVFSGFCVFLLMAPSGARADGVESLDWLTGHALCRHSGPINGSLRTIEFTYNCCEGK